MIFYNYAFNVVVHVGSNDLGGVHRGGHCETPLVEESGEADDLVPRDLAVVVPVHEVGSHFEHHADLGVEEAHVFQAEEAVAVALLIMSM